MHALRRRRAPAGAQRGAQGCPAAAALRVQSPASHALKTADRTGLRSPADETTADTDVGARYRRALTHVRTERGRRESHP